MFDEMVVSSHESQRRRISLGRWSFPWFFRSAFLAILILIPLIYTEALPKTMMATLLVAPPPPPPPPPPPAAQVVT